MPIPLPIPRAISQYLFTHEFLELNKVRNYKDLAMNTKSQRCSHTTTGATPQQINIAATNWVLKIDNEVEGAGGATNTDGRLCTIIITRKSTEMTTQTRWTRLKPKEASDNNPVPAKEPSSVAVVAQ